MLSLGNAFEKLCSECNKPGGFYGDGPEGRGTLCYQCYDNQHPARNGNGPETAEIEIVPLEEFAAIDEPGGEPIMGDNDSALFVEGSDAMIYGSGGASKTSLSVDLGFHLATGKTWLGQTIPKRRRVLIIENEGPRPLFRRKLKRKFETWDGPALNGHIDVWQAPWARFTFATDEQRERLAELVKTNGYDVIIAGPLSRIGMDGHGTLEEVAAFSGLVADVRARASKDLLVILIHHENRAGTPSGAWEPAGDTLLHLTCPCNGKTIMHIQKARWASDLHGKTLTLKWAPGETYIREDDRDYVAEFRDHLQARLELPPNQAWRTIKEIMVKEEDGGIGASEKHVKDALEGNPDIFVARTGDKAKAVGRRPNSTVFGLHDSPTPGPPKLHLA